MGHYNAHIYWLACILVLECPKEENLTRYTHVQVLSVYYSCNYSFIFVYCEHFAPIAQTSKRFPFEIKLFKDIVEFSNSTARVSMLEN